MANSTCCLTRLLSTTHSTISTVDISSVALLICIALVNLAFSVFCNKIRLKDPLNQMYSFFYIGTHTVLRLFLIMETLNYHL